MRKMFSKKQIQNMTLNYIEGFDEIELAGDLIVGGDLEVTGSIEGAEIVEKMSGYSATLQTSSNFSFENIYQGACKNGNKLTLVSAFKIARIGTTAGDIGVVEFTIPEEVGKKIYPFTIDGLSTLLIQRVIGASSYNDYENLSALVTKQSDTKIKFWLTKATELNNLTANQWYYVRIELTLLLGDNLIPAV